MTSRLDVLAAIARHGVSCRMAISEYDGSWSPHYSILDQPVDEEVAGLVGAGMVADTVTGLMVTEMGKQVLTADGRDVE